MKNKTIHNNNSERGSAFFYILLGVILFGTLAFTVSRGMRGGQTKSMTDRQAELAASEILDYAQLVNNAINRLRQKNISENDICFYSPNWGNVTYDACVAEIDLQVFHPDGGNAHFLKMNVDWIDPAIPNTYGEYGNIMYTGMDAVTGVGTDGAADSNQELIMTFPYIRKEICEFINKGLNLPYSTIPSAVTGFHPAASGKRFTGSYINGGWSTLYANGVTELEGESSACVERSGYYVFYNVLIAR